MRLLHSISRAASAASDAVENRLALLSAEIELERVRLVKLIWLGILGAGSLCCALLTIGALAVYLTPPEHREWTLGILAGALLLIALSCLLAVVHQIRNATPPFSASREEFQKDKECLASLTKS